MDQVSILSAYLWAFVTMVIFFLIAVCIANAILFRPNNPGTTARKLWFWILCVMSGVIGFLINYYIGSSVTVPSIKASYYTNAGIAAGVSIVFFILIGFAVSKMFPNSKVGTWF